MAKKHPYRVGLAAEISMTARHDGMGAMRQARRELGVA
jgi:hypothetical protein